MIHKVLLHRLLSILLVVAAWVEPAFKQLRYMGGQIGALSADAMIPFKTGSDSIQSYPVAASATIYKGALLCVNSSGYAQPATDAGSVVFIGVAYEAKNNSAGSDGDLDVRVMTRGRFLLPATSITQAMVGTAMYVVDDATVDDAAGSTYLVHVGKLVEYVSTTSGWVDIEPASEQVIVISVPIIQQAAEASGWTEGVGHAAMTLNISDKDTYVPVSGLQVGDLITDFHVGGGIGAAASNATVLDVSLDKIVGAAGGSTSTEIQAMTQLSKEADYKVDEDVTVATPEAVVDETAYYFTLTATTANNAACDVDVTDLEITVIRKRR